jgi:hypothetical protein
MYLEADIVSGGNGRVATTGDPVIQPGLIDINAMPLMHRMLQHYPE